MRQFFILVLCSFLFFPFSFLRAQNAPQENIIDDNDMLVNPDTTPENLQNQFEGQKNKASTKKSQASDSQQENVIIKNVNMMRYTEKPEEAGYTQAHLTGNVYVIYGDYHIWADEVILRFKNGKAEVFSAIGNVYLENLEQDQKVVAQKVFIYLKDQNMMILDSFKFQDGIFLNSYGLKLGKHHNITVSQVNLTNSRYLYPHYTIFGNQGYIEKEGDFLLTGSYIKVGQDPLIYLPIFFNIGYGSGIKSSVNYNYYLGMIAYNTYTKETRNYKEVFMFDYYQKLGQYVGNTYSRNDIGDLLTHIGFAYDKHIAYKDGYLFNIFEQIPGEGYSAGRSFRYHFLLEYEKDLIKSEDPNGFNLYFKGSFKEMSDPFFTNQFESARKEGFDFDDMLGSSTDTTLTRVSNSSNFSTVGRQISATLVYSFWGFKGDISQDIQYYLTAKKSNETQNTYSASYFENTLSSMTLPYITLRKRFDIYTFNQSFDNGQSLNVPIAFDVSSYFTNAKSYTTGILSSSRINSNGSFYLTSPISYRINNLFSLNFAIGMKYQLGYNEIGAYRTTGVTSSYYQSTQHTVDMNYSPSMKFSFLDSLWELNLVSNLNTNYINKNQNTRDATESQINNDNSNTYDTLNQTVGESISTSWRHDNPYYQGSVSAEYNYITSDKAGAKLPSNQQVSSFKHSYSGSLNILKSTLKVSSYDQKGNTITTDNQQGPLNLNLSSTIVPYITVGNDYIFDRYQKTASSNNFSLSFQIPLRVNVSDWLWFNSVNMDFGWSKNYMDEVQDYLTYRFYLDFNISKNWNFNLSLNGRNYQLYRYGASLDSGLKLNFWQDLLKSLAFWSAQLRQESAFKMESFSFTLAHDLDEWVLKASAEFAPKLGRTGAYYFESQFNFEVILKDFDMLSAPKISYGNSQQ